MLAFRDLQLESNLFLSPLAGYTNLPFRLTIREVGGSMERDPMWGAMVLAPLEIIGIESLADGAATIRTKFRTHPLSQGRVANELRRRLLGAFVGRGIKPYGGNFV